MEKEKKAKQYMPLEGNSKSRNKRSNKNDEEMEMNGERIGRNIKRLQKRKRWLTSVGINWKTDARKKKKKTRRREIKKKKMKAKEEKKERKPEMND